MPPAQDTLTSPVQFLKGIGPKRADLLKGLGVATLEDLLYYLPRDWEDRRETRDLAHPPAGKVVVRAKVESAELLPFRGRGLALFRARVTSSAGTLEALWFKRPTPRYDVFKSLRADIAPGREVWLVGRPENTLLRVTDIQVDEYYSVDDPHARLHVDRIVPVYPLTEGLSGRFVREAVAQALERASEAAPDVLPPGVVRERALAPIGAALRQVHFPDSWAQREEARRRLAYQEFFLIGMALALKRRQTKAAAKSFLYTVRKNLLTPFKEHLGFPFTRAQKKVISEIFTDMQGPTPMTRLLQGDVGAGKTVVAVSALLLAVENGYQGALMAPTEILAEQHYLTLQHLLRGLPVRVGLLTSKNKKKERAKLLEELKAGQVHILVGTHALLNEEVILPKLSLVVIDEQHRFGVRQRGELRRKGLPPDMLVMTATPIPRTLSLTLWGDLDISTLDELPPGRRPVETQVVTEETAFAALRREVQAGHQAYVVCPVIDETARGETKAAASEVDRMKALFPDLRIELLHGQMPPAKKDDIMEAFARGETDVLVATPVVEIGMDVSNATVMLIQHPERFGLASLHQLRGRVGRSQLESWCFLVGDPYGPAAERIETLCRTHDGFEISERDLVLRGPGEVLGVEQHGPLALRAGDLLRDLNLIKEAKTDSTRFLESDPGLRRPEHQALKTRLIDQYQRRWNWIDIS